MTVNSGVKSSSLSKYSCCCIAGMLAFAFSMYSRAPVRNSGSGPM
jgi:hypothetical protein